MGERVRVRNRERERERREGARERERKRRGVGVRVIEASTHAKRWPSPPSYHGTKLGIVCRRLINGLLWALNATREAPGTPGRDAWGCWDARWEEERYVRPP